MGIDRSGLNAILMSCKHIKNKQNLLTLGRQQIHTSQQNNIDIGDKFNTNLSEIIYGNYCETFFSSIGFRNIDSIDNSKYEGAKYVHNLNYPILEDFKNKYDYIYDGGTTQHIFNIPQVFENIIDMLNIDGLFVSVTCNNNFSGHGMYQFSPELYLSCFNKKYGMEILHIYIGENGKTSDEWKNVNSFNGYRNLDKFNSTLETYIIIIARKISNERELLLKNCPNQYSYEHEWKKYTYDINICQVENTHRYPFDENKIDIITYSQAHQDIFVTSLLQHKKSGYFVEIGTNDPIECNNTYLLEKNYNFKGLLVEYESYYKNKYEQHRPNSIYIIDDARNINYKKVLDDNKFPKNIDYLQIDLDVDNKSTLDTLILLDNTVFDTYKFSTITFEHDYYRGNFFNTREISREIFKKRGYLLVFPDVCTDQGCVGTGWQPFEDWYVHPDLVDMNLVNIIKTDKSLRNDHIKNILINNSSITSNNCNKSKKMKVIFSNNCSVGDIYFSQPFIKNIVTNNPEHDYYIYHQTCSYYFTDVLKIKDVNKIPELKELLYQVFNFKINLHELVNIDNMSSYIYRYDKTNNILLICTWLGCIRKKYPDMLECNMIKYNDTYKFLVYDLNKELDINLKFDHKLSLDIYPEVPTLNINKFREFKNKNFNKNIIFYYNFLPSSGQSYPVKNYNEHNEIIKNLSENNIVVVPHKQSYKGNTDNVYFADDFLENVEYYDAKNFYYHAQMAYESDYSIYYDLGRGFMSMNKKFIEENNCNIRLHITNNEYFYHSLNTNILIPNDYMKLVNVVDYIDIINKLNEIIKNKNL